jgi:hypothetical protein
MGTLVVLQIYLFCSGRLDWPLNNGREQISLLQICGGLHENNIVRQADLLEQSLNRMMESDNF